MSREHELYKDKIEVNLDGRQIFYLFFGGAVIVGMVFVLGVMVGRRVEARGHVERAHVEAAIDPLAALDRLEGGAGLSFQGSLRGAETATSDVEKKIAEIAKKKEPVDPKKADAAKKAEAEKQAEAAKAAELAKQAEVAKAAELAKQAEAAKQAELAKQAEADKKAELAKKAEADKAKKDGEKKDGEKKVAEADKKPADGEKKPDKAKFTLQLSSFQDKGEAESYVQSVKSSGFSAYIAEGSVDGKQYFRVRLGNYRTIDAANDAKADFEKASKKSALVTRL